MRCGERRALQEESEGEAGRRKRAHHSAHDGDDVLASGRHADVGAAVHGNALFGKLPEFFKDEAELRALVERAGYAEEAAAGSGGEGLRARQTGGDAEDHRRGEERPLRRAGLCGVCSAAAHARRTRDSRTSRHQRSVSTQTAGVFDFVLAHYVSVGVDELDQEKLTPLLRLKYSDSIADAIADLGNPDEISSVFIGFQKYLYAPEE